MAELRRDLLLQRWVVISDKRGKRPTDIKKKDSFFDKSDKVNLGPCVFCPGFELENGHETFALRDSCEDDAPDWRVRVIVNKFPAVSMDIPNGIEVPPIGNEGTMFCEYHVPGFGSHEVVIETPDHQLTIPELPVSQVAEVLKAYQARMQEFQKDPRIKFCQVFKNRGNRAGASMTHSHSQIMALPVITHNKNDEIQGAQDYYKKNKKCIFCTVIEHESQVNRIRLIDENEHFVSLAPYAPMFPYETWLMPKRHSSNYETIDEDEIQAMAAILKLTLQKIDMAFSFPPYNYMIQTAPLGEEHRNSPFYHWHLCIVPHLATPGGFELGSGCYINSIAPEKAAEVLRNVIPDQALL